MYQDEQEPGRRGRRQGAMVTHPPRGPTGGHFLIDRDQRLWEWSDGAARLLGVTSRHAVGRRCYEVVAGRDDFGRPHCGPGCGAVRALDLGALRARAALRIDRRQRPSLRIQCELTLLPGPRQGAFGHLAPRGNASSHLLDDMAAANALTGALATSASLQGGLRQALDLARQLTGADAAETFLTRQDGAEMIMASHRGRFRRDFTQILRFPRGTGFPGLILSTAQPILTDDLPHDARYLRSRVKERGFRAYACMPVVAGGRIVGSIHLAYRQPDADVERACRVLAWISGPVGLMVEASLAGAQESLTSRSGPESHAGGAGGQGALRQLLDRMVDVTEAQGGCLYVLRQEGNGWVSRVTQGTVPRSPCPSLRGQAGGRCPALARGEAVVQSRHPAQRPAACRKCPVAGSLGYCVPLFHWGRPVGLVQLHYQRLGAFPPTWNLVTAEALARAAAHRVGQVWQAQVPDPRRMVVRNRPSPAGSQPAGPVDEAALLGTNRGPGGGETASELLVHCLGRFELYRQGTLVTEDVVPRRKVLTLLKIFLAHRGGRLPNDVLMEWLWPEGDPEARKGQLYVLVHELRRLLEPDRRGGPWHWVRNVDGGYALQVEGPCWIDVHEFRRLHALGRQAEDRGDARAAVAAYREAGALYRGDFLEDDPYADWARQEREFLRESCLEILGRLAGLHGKGGAWREGILVLRRALRMDPLREEFHRELMYCLWAAGRRDEAVQQFGMCRDLLRRELDVDPLPETQRLVETIKASPRPWDPLSGDATA